MDHTYGLNIGGGGHLNANKFIDHVKNFKALSLLKTNCKIYSTHISHEGNPSYNYRDLQKTMDIVLLMMA